MEIAGGYELSRRYSAKEKVIMHLYLHRGRYADHTLPPDMTQQGMAEKLGLQRPHVSMVLKDLKLDGVVEERTCHVEGSPRMKKAYTLTRHGTETALDMGRILDGSHKEGLDIAIKAVIHRDEQKEKEPAEIPVVIPITAAPPADLPSTNTPAEYPPQEYVPSAPVFVHPMLPMKEKKNLPVMVSILLSFTLFFFGWLSLFTIYVGGDIFYLLPAFAFLILAMLLAFVEEEKHRGEVLLGHGIALMLSMAAAYSFLSSGAGSMLPMALAWAAVAVLFLEKNLKMSLKTSAVIALGVFAFLTTFVNLVFSFISIENPMLWILSGLSFFVLGYRTSEADETSLVLPDILLGAGLSVAVLSAFGILASTDSSLAIVFSLWICVGAAMMLVRFTGENVGESVSAIRVSLRFSLGGVFIVVGVLFLLAGRGMAGIIQLVIGALVVLGGITEIKDLKRPLLLLTIFMVMASAVTVWWFFA